MKDHFRWEHFGKICQKEIKSALQSRSKNNLSCHILIGHLKDNDSTMPDIRGNNILLQKGVSKDIYSLINHYTDAKDIWDNVKMLLEGSELTKEDRESQLYDDFKHFRQHKGETIMIQMVQFCQTSSTTLEGLQLVDQLYAYLKQHEAHANENKMMLDRFTQHTVDPLALMSNVAPQ
ncbi:hypothetical protein Tco_0530435 [Tanacetum coccineum]